jgi:phytoene synthase
MELIEQEALADELRLAIAHSPRGLQPRLTSFFAFDQRLARIIAQTTEPMLAQIRIAWWRDTLTLDPADRPQGDAVLDALGSHWSGSEDSLIELANGWEEMLAEPPISADVAKRFVASRIAPILVLGALEEGSKAHRSVNAVAQLWAWADLVLNTTDPDERRAFLAQGLQAAKKSQRLPGQWRGIAVLGALARRSLRKGGQPLMEGRGAALVAFRTGLLGL